MDIKQEVETQFARLRLADGTRSRDVTVLLSALRSPPVCSGRPLSPLARDSIVTGSTFATACGRPVGTAAAAPQPAVSGVSRACLRGSARPGLGGVVRPVSLSPSVGGGYDPRFPQRSSGRDPTTVGMPAEPENPAGLRPQGGSWAPWRV